MKRFTYIISIFVCILTSCSGTADIELGVPYVKYGLDSFPQHRIKEYFPYTTGQEVTFHNDKGEELELIVDKIYTNYFPYKKEFEHASKHDQDDEIWKELYDHDVLFKNKNSDNDRTCMMITLRISDKRSWAAWRITCDKEFGNATKAGGWYCNMTNPSKDPDVLFQLLKDTLLFNAQGTEIKDTPDYKAKIVKNLGLVEFTFAETGVHWYR